MKNIPTQSTSTTLDPADFNQIPDEMENKITSADITLDGGDLNQEGKATANYTAGASFYSCTNIGDDYTITPISPFQGITKYKDGFEVRFRPSITNTTQSPTINVNSKGVKDIVKPDGATQVEVGEINAGSDIKLRYDLSNDVFIIPAQVPTGTVIGNVEGFIPSNAADTNNDLTFSAGTREFSDGTFTSMTTAITKQKDVTFAEGNNAGGKASGATFIADSTVHCFFMTDSTNSKADIGFDTSSTATNLQADANVIAGNFTKFVIIFSTKLDSGVDFQLFKAIEVGGDLEIKYSFAVATDISVGGAGAMPVALTTANCNVPTGVAVKMYTWFIADDTADQTVNIKEQFSGLIMPDILRPNGQNRHNTITVDLWTDDATYEYQKGSVGDTTIGTFASRTFGYLYPRSLNN